MEKSRLTDGVSLEPPIYLFRWFAFGQKFMKGISDLKDVGKSSTSPSPFCLL
jgi:hypothetical protein